MNIFFLKTWFARLISILGSSLSTFGISVWVYEQTGKATPMAITLLCGILPTILFAPLSGIICDSINRKIIIITADTIAVCTTIGLLIYLILAPYNLIVVCIITLLNSTANMFDTNAYQASITTLLNTESIKKANGMNQIIESISTVVAPVSAGILYSFIGIKGLLLIDVGTYIIAMVIFVWIPADKLSNLKKIKKKNNPTISSVFSGFHFIFSQKSLTLLMLFFAFFNFLMNIANSLTEPLTLSVSSSMGLGIVKTFGGIGLLLGSLYITTHEIKMSYSKGIYLSAITAGFSMILIGIKNSIITIIIGEFLFLFVSPIVNTIAGTLWMLKTPPSLQGRVYAARSMVSRCIVPIAYLGIGPLVDVFIPNSVKNTNNIFFYIIGTKNINYRIVYVLIGIIAIITASCFFSNQSLKNISKEI